MISYFKFIIVYVFVVTFVRTFDRDCPPQWVLTLVVLIVV